METSQAADALESELCYRALFEHTNDAIFLLDLDGIILRANRQAMRLLGYSLAEILGRSILDLVMPEERQNGRERLQALLTGQSLPVYERQFRHKSGQAIPTEINIALVRDKAGNPLHIQSIVRDISRRKAAQQENEQLLIDLIHRSTQLLTAAEISKTTSTILNPDELTKEVVNVIQSRFGFYYVGLFLVDEAGEYAVLHAGTGEPGRLMLQAGHKLRIGGRSMTGQCIARSQARIALDVGAEAVRFDNPYLPLTRSEMALPLIARGQCIGALSVQSTQEAAFSLADVTALQTMADQVAIAITNARLHDQIQRYATRLEERVAERTAELAAVNRELEAFAYSVSHDLRAPLRSIDGFSQALLEDYADVLDARGKDYLRRVRAASQRMGRLIDDLLHLSRLTRREMHRQPVHLSEMAQQIAEDLSRQDPERQVEWRIAPDVVADGDPHLLRACLENLLGNAWKFTSKHATACIEFGVERDQEPPVYFVRDDGAGFDMAYADKLFGAFQRLHGLAEFEGTGIGLATVQRIIHRHGGRVWAEGKVEQGATFYFTLRGKHERQNHSAGRR
ncbi:MAG TPA: PAS domain S-box protein [Anaerolineae bacterium]|nr:PAS domain S-box protein [Anaerolineae bacterium]